MYDKLKGIFTLQNVLEHETPSAINLDSKSEVSYWKSLFTSCFKFMCKQPEKVIFHDSRKFDYIVEKLTIKEIPHTPFTTAQDMFICEPRNTIQNTWKALRKQDLEISEAVTVAPIEERITVTRKSSISRLLSKSQDFWCKSCLSIECKNSKPLKMQLKIKQDSSNSEATQFGMKFSDTRKKYRSREDKKLIVSSVQLIRMSCDATQCQKPFSGVSQNIEKFYKKYNEMKQQINNIIQSARTILAKETLVGAEPDKNTSNVTLRWKIILKHCKSKTLYSYASSEEDTLMF